MKKFIYLFIIIIAFILTGCSIANTPTSKVEELLQNYQRLDKKVNIDYQRLAIDTNLSENIINDYEQLIKDQYQKMSYEIKEETIDGNTAIVITSIKVSDYKNIISKYNKNSYSLEEYHNFIIKDLKNTKNKVTYTIEFTLTKDNKGNWIIDDLTNEMNEKLLGIN